MNREPVILGLDTASNRLHGIGATPLMVRADRYKSVTHLCPKKEKNPDIKRLELYRVAKQEFAILPAGSWVFCEEPMALQNGKTTRLLGLAAGAIWAAAQEFDIVWYWVNVAEWKSGIGLKASAKKEQVREYVMQHYPEMPGWGQWEEDHFDACAIREWGEARLKEANLIQQKENHYELVRSNAGLLSAT